MRDLLPRLYAKKEQEVRGILDQSKWCAITRDFWTSCATMGYMTITCHLFDDGWQMRSFVLETSHIDEAHTIAAALKMVTEKWNITKKVHCGAIRSNRFVCFAHRLNLVVTCAINDVEELQAIVAGIKRIVTYFHKSSKATDKLTVIQDRLSLPNHRLIQHVDKRWNSIFYMMERYLLQQEAVRTVFSIKPACQLSKPFEASQQKYQRRSTCRHPWSSGLSEAGYNPPVIQH